MEQKQKKIAGENVIWYSITDDSNESFRLFIIAHILLKIGTKFYSFDKNKWKFFGKKAAILKILISISTVNASGQSIAEKKERETKKKSREQNVQRRMNIQ